MFGRCSQAQGVVVGVSCAAVAVDDRCGPFHPRIFHDSVIPGELGLSSVTILQDTLGGTEADLGC